VVLVMTDVSEELISSIFKLRVSESPWLTARIYLTADEEEIFLQLYIYSRK
jgi:hypothetical protein